jgi:hypothetical protein
MIIRDFSRSELKGLSEPDKSQLTKAYLYELRDLKSNSAATYTAVDAKDVADFSPGFFFKQAGLEKKIGYLRCLSKPEGGAILIDGMAKGRTTKEFVLSTGAHSIVIDLPEQSCKESVSIEEGKMTESRCPRD